MQETAIKCPSCAHVFNLNDLVLREAVDEELKKREVIFKDRERGIVEKEKALELRQKSYEEKAKQYLAEEKIRIKKELSEELSKKIQGDVEVKIKDLEEQNKEKEQKLAEARNQELLLRKQQRELEERQKNFELEKTRELDAEREKIRRDAIEKIREENQSQILQKDKMIQDLQMKIEELNRQSKQGSQQLQGEVLEIELERHLKNKFPFDQFEAVPTGIRGADLIQRVINRQGQVSGTLLWEFKNTKNWQDGWIQKLKDDQREIKAEVSILVTTATPKDLRHFGWVDGVWICDPICFLELAFSLRQSLLELQQVRLASLGKNEKMEALHGYLTSPMFRQKIESMVETFKTMKDDLESERRAIQRLWAKREQHIRKIEQNISVFYGELQGIMGAAMDAIPELDFERVDRIDEAKIQALESGR